MILQIIVIFSTLDAKIDFNFPNLQGQSYRNKYLNLPHNTDKEIILRECYRIYKVLRNVAVHSMNSITVSNEKVVAQYNFNRTNYHLDISNEGVSYLFTYILESFNSNSQYTLNHDKALTRDLYDLIRQGINSFEDEFGIDLEPISNRLKIRSGIRNYIVNASFEINEKKNTLKIITPYIKSEIYEKEYGVDYLIQLPNTTLYLIPDAVLNGHFEIELTKIDDWRLNHD